MSTENQEMVETLQEHLLDRFGVIDAIDGLLVDRPIDYPHPGDFLAEIMLPHLDTTAVLEVEISENVDADDLPDTVRELFHREFDDMFDRGFELADAGDSSAAPEPGDARRIGVTYEGDDLEDVAETVNWYAQRPRSRRVFDD